jgi:hypothetical protein
MIDFLLGVPGKLKTISDYLTTYLSSTRAAKIDNLDVVLSTRAASSTAVSSADLTPARAGYLDKLNTGVTGAVKSIQTGYASTNAASASNGEFERYIDATISAVTIAKCVVLIAGAGYNLDPAANGGMYVYPLYGSLTSTTNLRMGTPTDYAIYLRVRWTVIEYY